MDIEVLPSADNTCLITEMACYDAFRYKGELYVHANFTREHLNRLRASINKLAAFNLSTHYIEWFPKTIRVEPVTIKAVIS